jgi:hypothetical protein
MDTVGFEAVAVRSPDRSPEDFNNNDEIDSERNSNMWNCCLFGSSDRNCLRFITITSLSFFIVGFSASMLAFADLPCQEQHTFVGLITLILGFWLKSNLD